MASRNFIPHGYKNGHSTEMNVVVVKDEENPMKECSFSPLG
jgi:hypothetical protein